MQASSSAAQASSSFGDWMPWRWAAAAAALPTTTPRADHEQEEEQEEEEEDGVAPDRILLVVHSTQPALQCALLLNSAKCSLMARDWPSALSRALRAERCAAHDVKEPAKTRALRRTALIVCARATLGMQRFGSATSYAALLLAAGLPDDAKQTAAAAKEVRALLRDIQRRSTEVKRSNQRLAKSISTWVAAAMEESGQQLPDGMPMLE